MRAHPILNSIDIRQTHLGVLKGPMDEELRITHIPPGADKRREACYRVHKGVMRTVPVGRGQPDGRAPPGNEGVEVENWQIYDEYVRALNSSGSRGYIHGRLVRPGA